MDIVEVEENLFAASDAKVWISISGLIFKFWNFHFCSLAAICVGAFEIALAWGLRLVEVDVVLLSYLVGI